MKTPTDAQIEEIAAMVERHAGERFRVEARHERERTTIEARQRAEREALAQVHGAIPQATR